MLITVISLLIGVLSSFIASCISLWIGVHYERIRQRKKYSGLEGKYSSFRFSDSDGRQLESAQAGTAVISYLRDNLLSIELTHDHRTWFGTILMEAGNAGTIVWRYIDLPENQREFGLKRCIAEKDEVYLIGDQIHGYGKEVLQRIRE